MIYLSAEVLTVIALWCGVPNGSYWSTSPVSVQRCRDRIIKCTNTERELWKCVTDQKLDNLK